MNKLAAKKSMRRGLFNSGLPGDPWGTRRSGIRTERPRGRRLTIEPLEARTLLAAGDLDPTFGEGGLVTTDIGFIPGDECAFDAVAVQADGKIVVVGNADAPGSTTRTDFALARYDSNGSLDTSFGVGGKVATDFGNYTNQDSIDYVRAVAIYPDGDGPHAGKIVVAGSSGDVYDGTTFDFALARYNSDGSLDTGFGGDGTVTTDFHGDMDFGYGVAIDAAGKIVVAGYSWKDATTGVDFALARYNDNGSLDTSFDPVEHDGKVTTDFGGSDDSGYDVAIGADGKIVVVGRSWKDVTTGVDFALARYNGSDGSLDLGFGDNGTVTTDFHGASDHAYGVAIDADGKIVVVGFSNDGTTGDFALTRYNGSDGSLDTSLGGADGMVTIDVGGYNDYAQDVAIDSEGRILVGGYCESGNFSETDFALACYDPNTGGLDTTFGQDLNGDGVPDGKVITDFGSDSDYAYGVAVDGDDKIVLAGYSRQGYIHDGDTGVDFALARYTTDGNLDGSFGTDGKVLTDIGKPGTQDHGRDLVATQADGKIVVVGDSQQGQFGSTRNDFALARYNSDGSLDTTFGNGGKVTTDFNNPSHDYATAVAVDDNGKIVVVGYSYQYFVNTTRHDFAVARYNTDGSLDTSFDGDGKVTTDFSFSDDYAYGVDIDDAGNIVVAGYARPVNTTRSDFALVRYNGSDGSLDTSFDPVEHDGKVTTDFGPYYDRAHDVAIDPAGKIVVVGRSGQGGTNGYDFALARYESDGSLDSTFDSDGKVLTDFDSYYDTAYSVAIDAAGEIVVAGGSLQGGDAPGSTWDDFALARYKSDGSLDTTFDPVEHDGKVTTDFGSTTDFAYDLAIDAEGRIVAAGHSQQGGTTDNDFALARYTSDGSLDATFGTGGLATTDFGSYTDYAYGVAIDGDGKIVAAGSSDNDFALARYEADFGVAPVTAPAGPVDVDAEITVSAVFTDQDLTHTHTATWDWGDGITSPGNVTEPSSPGLVTGSHTYAVTGVYTITLTVTVNETGNSDQSLVHDVVVRRPVEIDVKPGSDPNAINLASNGVIAAAILTTDSFDASLVDATTVVFAGAHAVHSALEDTDGDGDLDLILHFEIQETNLADVYAQLVADDLNGDGVLDSNHQTTAVSLTGQTATDEYFQGFDDVDLFLSGKKLRAFLEDLAAAGAI